MANQAEIKAVITAEDKASGILKGFGDSVDSIGGKVLGVAKVAGESLLAAGAAAAGFGALSVKAYTESQNVQAQLNAALESTHHAAGLFTQDLNDQAQALQRVTKFSDEQINASQAMLLTFTNIHGEIFQRTTPIILDLATAMHEDLQSASIQVGKALNDPVLGITALHRIGVTFSQTQKDQIQAFMDTNQLAKAQGVILAELTKEFGGSAVAAGKTFSGQLEILKNQLNDVEEKVGSVIVKALTPFAVKAIKAVESLDWDRIMKTTINAIKDFWKELDNAWQKIDKVYQAVDKYLEPKINALMKTLQQSFPTFRKFIDEYINPLAEIIGVTVGKSLVWAIGLVIDTLNVLIKIATPIFEYLDKHRDVVYFLAAAFGTLALKMALGAAFDAIRVAFVVFQTIQVPSMIATLQALGAAFWAAFPLAAIAAAAVIAFEKINAAARATLAQMDKTKAAIESASKSDDDAIRKIEDAFNQGKITKTQEMKMINDITGARASGGQVLAGKNYLVGEQGMEIFSPSQNGTIIPNNKLGSVNSGGDISITIQAGAFMGSQIDARKYAMQIMQALQDVAAKKNTTVANLIGVN